MTRGDGEDDRPPDGRRRLPGPERGDPRGRPAAPTPPAGTRSPSLEGWRGLVEGRFKDLGVQEVSGILPRGGTIIGTSRTNPYKLDGGVEKVLQNFRDRELDALVAIGGEDTLGVAAKLFDEHGFPVVGVPKTIDNDLSGHRLHLRLRHRGVDRHRGDRPPAHDGRVAQPRHGRRGHGPPRRLDRRHERHRRRRRRHPHPGAARRLSRTSRETIRQAPRARQELLHRRRQRGLRAPRSGEPIVTGERRRPVRPRDRLGGVGEVARRARSSSAPASRRA